MPALFTLISSQIWSVRYWVIGAIVVLFSFWSFLNYSENIKLKRENTVLLNTKKAQENIIAISDYDKKRTEKLNEMMIKKQSEIKHSGVENISDFIEKSSKVFKNFGNN